MKKFIILFWVSIIALSLSAQVIYSENFDSYTSGNKVALTVLGWTTWSNLPGSAEDGTITTLHSSSGNNSVAIGYNNDLIWKLGDSVSGKYEVSLKIFVPNDSAAYFNLLHNFNGNASEWSNEVMVYSQDSSLHLIVGGNDTAFVNFSFNTWNTVSYIIDTDFDFISFSLDGSVVFSWQFSLEGSGNISLNQIGAMDFFGYDIYQNGKTRLYIDDVKFEKIDNTSLNDLNLEFEFKIYPSPVMDNLNLESSKYIKTLKIFDINGSLIKNYKVEGLNFTKDISDLPTGYYYAQINFGNSIAVRKIIKE